jgi:ABC-type transporter Mla subunit MlaD
MAAPRAAVAALLLAPFVALGATGRCAKPAFEFYVTFPDAQGLDRGSDVLYAGIPVGEVLDLSIHQPDPRAAGRVRVHVAIRDAALRVRRGDRFRVARAGWLSGARLEIEPGEEEADPLGAGATIAGEPAPSLDAWRSRVSDYVRSLVGSEVESPSPSPQPP